MRALRDVRLLWARVAFPEGNRSLRHFIGSTTLIDSVDCQLVTWAKTHSSVVLLERPANTSETLSVRIHLLCVRNEPAARSSVNELRLQVLLQYLITTSGPDSINEHKLLWDLIVSAVEQSRNVGWRLDFAPLSSSDWAAFGVVPQPSFILGVPVAHEWEQADVPRVRHPPELEASPGIELSGTVVGPENFPLSGARVELPSLQLTSVTDAEGKFLFSPVPSGRHFPSKLIVKTKRQEQMVKLKSRQQGKPLTIHFKLEGV